MLSDSPAIMNRGALRILIASWGPLCSPSLVEDLSCHIYWQKLKLSVIIIDAVCNPQIHPDISRGSRLRVADVHRGGGAVGFRDRSGNLLPGHMLQECKLGIYSCFFCNLNMQEF